MTREEVEVHMSDERDRREEGDREERRDGLGILSTLREVLDEIIAEARDKGGISADRARDAVRDALTRARGAAGEARERLDFASQQELHELRDTVQELRVRLENLERRSAQDPSAGASRPSDERSSGGA